MGLFKILMKKLYKGIFNFRIGIVRKYCKAHSLKQAELLMIKQIAKDQEVNKSFIKSWMTEHLERWKIELEEQ